MSELEAIVKSLTDEVANLKNVTNKINSFILALQTVSAIVGVIILIKILI